MSRGQYVTRRRAPAPPSQYATVGCEPDHGNRPTRSPSRCVFDCHAFPYIGSAPSARFTASTRIVPHLEDVLPPPRTAGHLRAMCRFSPPPPASSRRRGRRIHHEEPVPGRIGKAPESSPDGSGRGPQTVCFAVRGRAT